MIKITTNEVAKWLRICLYQLGAGAMAHGVMAADNWTLVSGILLNIGLALWTAWASTVAAKINALLGTGLIEIVVTKDPVVADAVDSSKVVSVSQVQDPNLPTKTDLVKITPV